MNLIPLMMSTSLFIFSLWVSQADEPPQAPSEDQFPTVESHEQEAVPPPPPTSPQAPLTNEGEPFQDPFRQPAPAPEKPAIEASPQTPPVQPAPIEAPEGVAPAPQSLPPPPALEAPKSTPAPQPDFGFPEEEPAKGPISEEVVRREEAARHTKAETFSLEGEGGGAFNLNKRPGQIHLEALGMYRVNEHDEFGISISFRALKDKLLGFNLKYNRVYQISDSQASMRFDWEFGGGLGWVLRAPNTRFTEQRLAVQASAGLLFYPWHSLALVPSVEIESFMFGITNGGKYINLFKSAGPGQSSGPPTQGIVKFGLRYEF